MRYIFSCEKLSIRFDEFWELDGKERRYIMKKWWVVIWRIWKKYDEVWWSMWNVWKCDEIRKCLKKLETNEIKIMIDIRCSDELLSWRTFEKKRSQKEDDKMRTILRKDTKARKWFWTRWKDDEKISEEIVCCWKISRSQGQ